MKNHTERNKFFHIRRGFVVLSWNGPWANHRKNLSKKIGSPPSLPSFFAHVTRNISPNQKFRLSKSNFSYFPNWLVDFWNILKSIFSRLFFIQIIIIKELILTYSIVGKNLFEIDWATSSWSFRRLFINAHHGSRLITSWVHIYIYGHVHSGNVLGSYAGNGILSPQRGVWTGPHRLQLGRGAPGWLSSGSLLTYFTKWIVPTSKSESRDKIPKTNK